MIYPELEGSALEAFRQMLASLKSKAMKELRLPEDQIVVRDLRPEDYGAASADLYCGILETAWGNIINAQTIGDNRFIGINGFFMASTCAAAAGTIGPSPAVTQIRVTRKGSVTRYWYVQPIVGFEGKTGWFDDPFTADQNTTITIESWNRIGGSIGAIGFLGAVVEKRGVLINP